MMTNLRMRSLPTFLRKSRNSLGTIKDLLISLRVNLVHPEKIKEGTVMLEMLGRGFRGVMSARVLVMLNLSAQVKALGNFMHATLTNVEFSSDNQVRAPILMREILHGIHFCG